MIKQLVFLCGLAVMAFDVTAQQGNVNSSGQQEVDCKHLQADYARSCGDLNNIDSLRGLSSKECVQIKVNSQSLWNASGIRLEKGVTYRMSAGSGDIWFDASIDTDAEGWCIEKKNEACTLADTSFLENIFFKAAEVLGLRRHSDADWFELIGVNGNRSHKRQFRIGKSMEYTPDQSGEFCAYANDLNGFYWNNSGSITLRIERAD